MSIVINGIKMPEAPDEMIELAIYGDGTVIQTGESWRSPEDGKCYYTVTNPEKFGNAVSVPPHGRLGDLDELHKEAVRRSEKAGTHDIWYNCADRVICALDIKNAPTIIPASEEGKT